MDCLEMPTGIEYRKTLDTKKIINLIFKIHITKSHLKDIRNLWFLIEYPTVRTEKLWQ